MTEPSRREFLGAAAALAALPSAATGQHGSESSPADPDNNGFGSREVISDVDGDFQVSTPDLIETKVFVESWRDGVGLAISNGLGSARANLYPDDVDKLIEELEQARSRVIPAEVKISRGLDEKYPPKELHSPRR